MQIFKRKESHAALADIDVHRAKDFDVKSKRDGFHSNPNNSTYSNNLKAIKQSVRDNEYLKAFLIYSLTPSNEPFDTDGNYNLEAHLYDEKTLKEFTRIYKTDAYIADYLQKEINQLCEKPLLIDSALLEFERDGSGIALKTLNVLSDDNHTFKKSVTYNTGGRPTSFNDEPAIIYDSGLQAWCDDGTLHREDDVAVIYEDGSSDYYLNNEKAFIDSNTNEIFIINVDSDDKQLDEDKEYEYSDLYDYAKPYIEPSVKLGI